MAHGWVKAMVVISGWVGPHSSPFEDYSSTNNGGGYGRAISRLLLGILGY